MQKKKRRSRIKLILFDIDGTILHCNGAGKRSLLEASIEVFGTSGTMEHIPFQGKTDPNILKEAFNGYNVNKNHISDKMVQFKSIYFEILKKRLEETEVIVYPGIKDILMNLSKRKDIILGLLTGNFSESAKIKLEKHQLNDFFSFGAFGDDAKTRNLLPDVAQRRIREIFNKDIAFKDTYIIGDTIHDIRCAKYAGAKSVAVGTGWSDIDELKGENPDYYFENFKNYNDFLNILED